MSSSLFYILGVLAVISALIVVFSRNPIHSVLALIFTMFCLAGEYILINAQFLAVVHIIVYAGAIMVLFLFVLMLLNLNKDTEPQKSASFQLMGTVAGGSLLVTLVGALRTTENMIAAPGEMNPGVGLTKNLGKVLFTEYVVPFEIASVLFLAAMVGAVMIGKKDQKDNNSYL